MYIVQVKSKMRKHDKEVKGLYAKMMSAFKFWNFQAKVSAGVEFWNKWDSLDLDKSYHL